MRDNEIFRLGKAFHNLSGGMVAIGCYHHRAHVLHVGSDGKTEEEHQHDRHTEEDKHGTLVTQYVLCFLAYEGYKLFHDVSKLITVSCCLSG